MHDSQFSIALLFTFFAEIQFAIGKLFIFLSKFFFCAFDNVRFYSPPTAIPFTKNNKWNDGFHFKTYKIVSNFKIANDSSLFYYFAAFQSFTSSPMTSAMFVFEAQKINRTITIFNFLHIFIRGISIVVFNIIFSMISFILLNFSFIFVSFAYFFVV